MAKRSKMQPLTDEERDVVEANQGLVFAAVKALSRGGQLSDDELQVGMLALMRAAKTFDAAKGYAFSTYATICIRMSIFRHRQNDWLIHVPDWVQRGVCKNASTLAEARVDMERAAGVGRVGGRDGYGEDDRLVAAADDGLDAREAVAALRAAVADLPDREFRVVMGVLEGRALKAMAPEFGVTRTRLGQLRLRALARLRETLAAHA